MKIALFGTSADPPTFGHLAILRWLVQRFDHVAVWASDNPFKAKQVELYHRTRMMQLLVQELQLPATQVRVYPELSYPRTLFTLAKAKEYWPEGEFTLTIGADIVPQIPTWYQAQQLLSQVHLVVIPRSGYALEPQAIEQLRQLGTTVEIADLETPDVSSTAYRTYPQADSVPPSIQSYIQQEQLYEWPDETQKPLALQQPVAN
ncbi:nicotinate-nucleotide adenylyltransferase [Alkalinema sp. FACHB-956]|uniref:nicotinate-nucleotide adenylyltransferase n=1 Tax=Alkalinema sp. FACHB-956 TaxID=2692768 RepID=UPI0016877165|nr:nicotinate-nucleotide adenylyltransferase [Alkalinema sp. FACHB-956]MBD2327546.1 nicotinate-nucleotide adenylyltransferase [Alkalinema sp. FACHB-956]